MKFLIAIFIFNLPIFNIYVSQKPASLKFTGSVNTIVFSPDGTRLLVSMDDSTAKILDAVSGTVLRTLKGHKNKVNTAFYSPNGKLIVTASEDKTAKIWNAVTGEFMFDLVEKEYGISSAQFSPDGKKILTVCPTAIKIWKAENAIYENQIINVPGGIYTTACFSADGRFVFTGSSDKSVKKWVIGYDKPLATMMKHAGMVGLVCASTDGKFLISGGMLDKSVFVWDAKEGYSICSIPNQVISKQVQYSPDGKFFLVNGVSVNVVSLTDCKVISDKIFDEEELIINTAIFSPDGSKILTVSVSGAIKYWEVQTGKYLSTL